MPTGSLVLPGRLQHSSIRSATVGVRDPQLIFFSRILLQNSLDQCVCTCVCLYACVKSRFICPFPPLSSWSWTASGSTGPRLAPLWPRWTRTRWRYVYTHYITHFRISTSLELIRIRLCFRMRCERPSPDLGCSEESIRPWMSTVSVSLANLDILDFHQFEHRSVVGN